FGETEGGLLYIVMEYVDGTDVARMIAKEGRLHTEHAMAITAHVCDALAYAHERGIIHRDIKPANIMVGYDGVVKVADFGLAKMTQSANTGLTQSGMAMGTLHYMAPEALMLGSAVDHRADIYAVGVMLYQMLTGKIPQGMFKLPSLQIGGLDPRYDGIIAKAIMEDREARYQTVRELRGDLDHILTQPVEKVEPSEEAPAALPTEVRPRKPGARQPQRPSQSPAHASPKAKSSGGWFVGAVLAILALGGGWWWLDHGSPPSKSQKPALESAPVAEVKPATPAPVRTAPAVPVTSVAPPVATTPAKGISPDGIPAFFDDKSLSGWTSRGTAVWRVEQGAITSDSGGTGTVSRSLDSPWFELTGEVYVSADGNGGIHFQITDLLNFTDGVEVQLCGSKARNRGVGAGGLFAPKLGKAGNVNGRQSALPDAQFTPFRLVVEEGRVRFWLAGEQVFEAKHTLRPELRTLALSRLGPPGKVAYRNLRLKLPEEKANASPPAVKSDRIDGLVANGQWQDVLRPIGESPRIKQGEWEFKNGVLKCIREGANAMISVDTQPLESYTARIRYVSPKHSSMTVFLPTTTHGMNVTLSEVRKTVHFGIANDIIEHTTLAVASFGGQEHEWVIEVEPRLVRVFLDKVEIRRLENPDWNSITHVRGYPASTGMSLGVGASVGLIEFRSFEINIPAIDAVAARAALPAASAVARSEMAPVPGPTASASTTDVRQPPELLTRVANYQKARHAQLTDLTAKYRAALSSEKDAAIKSGVLADATAANSALAAADAFSKVVEASLTSSDVAPLPALAAVADPAPQRLKELR
ncbi:protein kinase, partial [Prosthecobacter sp.]|uniref:protein kinase domain-containing protein n=1 Tax=Prosthecobacter sp. TaxID=1965333 RepID=UPI001DD353AE